MNQTHSSALNCARAQWQPATAGKTDAADFAGFWSVRVFCLIGFILESKMSVGTIILIILVIVLLGGFSGLGGGPFYGTGYYGGGGLGLVIVILLILLLMGRL
jgi:Protein of unknown function (DUF3309)